MNEQIAAQRRVHSSLEEPLSADKTKAIEQYHTLIGEQQVLVPLSSCLSFCILN